MEMSQTDRIGARIVRPHVTALGSISKGVLSAEGGFVFDERYFLDPDYRWEQDKRIARFVEDRYAPIPLYYFEGNLVQPEYLPIPFRLVGGLQPNMILGAAVGANWMFFDHQDADITQNPLRGLDDIDKLADINWEQREPIKTFLNQIDEMNARYGADVDVFPPFFWDRSGRATVHGPLTTAHKLMGEDIYLKMSDDLDFVDRLLRWISETYVKLIHLFSDRAELPVRSIHIGECSGCMISADHWERLIIPAMNMMADACGPVRLHSCGDSNHILEQMAKVHNLGALNVGSGASVARSREFVGEEIPLHVNPDVHMLSKGTTEDCKHWVARSIEESGSGPLSIAFHVDTAVPLSNVAALFDAVREHDYEPYQESLVDLWGI